MTESTNFSTVDIPLFQALVLMSIGINFYAVGTPDITALQRTFYPSASMLKVLFVRWFLDTK